MPNDSDFFTEEDKKDIAYHACVGGMTLIGASVGSFAGNPLVGGAFGFIYGLASCKKLSVPIRQKLFSSNQTFSDSELASLVSEIQSQRPSLGKREALSALASVRVELARNPEKYRDALSKV